MTKTNKLKILMCSEASFIKSGFGIYTKELLSRLHKTGKYEIAEFASYGFVNDPRDKDIPWKYYANAVRDSDPRNPEYTSRTDNQFGRWRFEKVLLDFKPDVVIDIRDYWMSSYQNLSPLRPYFHWILMPTVDSYPQQEEWIDTFINADAIFTYSDWGADVLKKQSNNSINYIDTASPGIDCDIYTPKDKKAIKSLFRLPDDSIIIGTVMRNQKRKLFPELFASFRKVLDHLQQTNDIKTAQKLFLYVHTSYPDMGWNIPQLLKDYNIANKVLFTYTCKNCKQVQCSKFHGPTAKCPKCSNNTLSLPSVTNGVTTEDLVNIYNLFDLYVQYSICEGFGMPQVEAGACGVPIATVNYSAMVDIVNKLKAYPIKIKSEFKELETQAIRVYPDNDDLCSFILKFINTPTSIRNKHRQEIHELTHKHYNWEDTAKIWENYLDKLDNSGYRSEWNARYDVPNLEQFKDKNHFDTLMLILNNVLKQPDLIGEHQALLLLNNVDYGFVNNQINTIQPYSIEQLYKHYSIYINNINSSNNVLRNNVQFDDDFIKYANLKHKANS
jgi:glycosyltransferase involved in cell wall biosynthesis